MDPRIHDVGWNSAQYSFSSFLFVSMSFLACFYHCFSAKICLFSVGCVNLMIRQFYISSDDAPFFIILFFFLLRTQKMIHFAFDELFVNEIALNKGTKIVFEAIDSRDFRTIHGCSRSKISEG